MIRRPFGIRAQITDTSVTDHKLEYSPASLAIVLRDWETIRESYTEVAANIFFRFIKDYPNHRDLFPGLSEVDDDDLEYNRAFMNHSYAILNCIQSILRSLTGEYEDDGVLLRDIGRSHKKRGITRSMFGDLKETALSVFSQHLQSDRKSREAWSEIINFIFDKYLCAPYGDK